MARTLRDLRALEGAYDSDKAAWPDYLEVYQEVLAPYRDKRATIFELGVRNGGSLLMWRDFLPSARVVGLDLELPALDDEEGRVRLYQGSQDDEALLRRIADEQAPDGFDVVIDDCAHEGRLAAASFRVLYPLVRPGGVYVIEDWGTGYWPDWVDGEALPRRSERRLRGRADEVLLRLAHRTGPDPLRGALTAARRRVGAHRQVQHVTGMVGFVKSLVDEVAAEDVRRGGGEPGFGAPVAELVVRPRLVLVRKPATLRSQG